MLISHSLKHPILDCYDLTGCAKAKYNGDCEKREWQTYLKQKCRKTCGFCKVTGGGGGPNTPRPNTPGPNTPKPNTPGPGIMFFLISVLSF